MFQIQIRSRGMASESPDISLLNGVFSEQILKALRVAADKLEKGGIRHALAGSLAVGGLMATPGRAKISTLSWATRPLLFMPGALLRSIRRFQSVSATSSSIRSRLGLTNPTCWMLCETHPFQMGFQFCRS